MAQWMVGELAPSDHAEAIGQLVIAWSSLEYETDALVIKLANMDALVALAMLGHIDFREKLAITKSLGFLFKPNDEWFEFLERTVNQIDNVLRPFRNRIVHDSWTTANHAVMMQTNREPKLTRPQARKRSLQAGSSKQVTAADIAKGVKWAKIALGSLQMLQVLPPASDRTYPLQSLDWS